MKLIYKEPEIIIRKYDFPSNTLFTTASSTEPPGLEGGEDYGDIFA